MNSPLQAIVDTWGPRLFWGGVVYSMVYAIIAVSLLGAGVKIDTGPAAMLQNILSVSMNEWRSLADVLSQPIDAGRALLVSYRLMRATISTMYTLLGLFASAVFSYILLAVQVSQLLPPPFTLVSVIVWIAAAVAETIVIQYVVEKMIPIVNRIISLLGA